MIEDQIIAGRYQIVRRLGGGGMGEVWAALRLDDFEMVAVKFIRPELVTDRKLLIRFMREAIAAAEAQRSEHIIKVFDSGQADDSVHFMVMEYLEGESLREVMDREEKIDVPRACGFIVQACGGLAEVHGQGIIHRDIKPENLMLVKDERGRERVKILDFGIAKFRRSPDGETRTLTEKGGVTGTPFYLAPERCDGSGRLDHRSDIYALGIVLYEMLAGKPPFVAPVLSALVLAILEDEPKRLMDAVPSLPPGLSAITMKAISKEPEERFAAVDEFAALLRPFSVGAGSKPGQAIELGAFDPPAEFWEFVEMEEEDAEG